MPGRVPNNPAPVSDSPVHHSSSEPIASTVLHHVIEQTIAPIAGVHVFGIRQGRFQFASIVEVMQQSGWHVDISGRVNVPEYSRYRRKICYESFGDY